MNAAGELFIAELDNHRVRKVDTSGIITTFAGSGNTFPFVDGGAATDATLSFPQGISGDADGNIFIVEGNRVRKVDSAGIITTIGGTGSFGFAGDGNPATDALLNAPQGVFVNTLGDVFIADELNNRIRKILPGEVAPPPPPPGNVLSGNITENRTLTADQVYLLSGDVIFGDATPDTLTIEPGTKIIGEGATNGTLIISQGAYLLAAGTVDSPIVFTSDQGPSAVDRGQWGGIVINGRAPVNESFPDFGGTDPDDDSGILRYVRVEFAGSRSSSALSLRGVGAGTTVDFVQVHFSGGDGIEIIGGTVDVKHVLATGNLDDSMDWDLGWTGRGQFIVAQQRGDFAGDGFEADNNPVDNDILPRSAPQIYNATLVGDPNGPESAVGVLLGGGTAGTLRNFIVTGFNQSGLDINDQATISQTISGDLSVQSSIFFNNATDIQLDPSGAVISRDLGNFSIDVDGIEETSWALTAGFNNAETDPLLGDPNNLTAPDFQPGSGSPATDGTVPVAAPPADGFFDPVTFIGGVGSTDNWVAGWTTNVVPVLAVPPPPPFALTTSASGLLDETLVSLDAEVQVLSLGVTGNGSAGINFVRLIISDLSGDPTGLAPTDLRQLRLYRSLDATLDGGDTQIGTRSAIVNIGGTPTEVVPVIGTPINILPTSTEIPPAGSETFYIVSVVISSDPKPDRSFRVGFPAGGLSTTVGNLGAPVTALDANRVTIERVGLELTSQVVAGKTVTVWGQSQNAERITWDWDDGTAVEETFFPAVHTYAAPGVYTVTATAINDTKGLQTAKTITVTTQSLALLDLDDTTDDTADGNRKGIVTGLGTEFTVQVFAKDLSGAITAADVVFGFEINIINLKPAGITTPAGVPAATQTGTGFTLSGAAFTPPGDGHLADVVFVTQQDVSTLKFKVKIESMSVTDAATAMVESLPVKKARVAFNTDAVTPTGTDVSVNLTDENSLESPMDLSFGDVTSGGETTMETVDPTEGPPPPSGFQFNEQGGGGGDGIGASDQTPIFSVETTATFAGPVEMCINYSNFGVVNEVNLRLFHFVGSPSVWTDITTSVDFANNIICGEATSFSFFTLLSPTPPEVPIPSFFAGASLTNTTPTLDWNDVQDATSYTIEVAANLSFTGATTTPGITQSDFTLSTPLSPDTYFWHVKLVGDGGESVFSSSDNFVIEALTPDTPVLTTFGGGTTPSTTPVLDWSDVTGATSYTLEHAENADFTSSTVITGIAESQFLFTEALEGKTVFWHVKAVGSGGESSFSAADSFVLIEVY